MCHGATYVGCKYSIILICTLKSYFSNANHLLPTLFSFGVYYVCVLFLQRHCFLVDFLLGVIQCLSHSQFIHSLILRCFFFPSFCHLHDIISIISCNPPLCWGFWRCLLFDAVCLMLCATTDSCQTCPVKF